MMMLMMMSSAIIVILLDCSVVHRGDVLVVVLLHAHDDITAHVVESHLPISRFTNRRSIECDVSDELTELWIAACMRVTSVEWFLLTFETRQIVDSASCLILRHLFIEAIRNLCGDGIAAIDVHIRLSVNC